MKQVERDEVMQKLSTLLQDNAGNRITMSLVNGVIVTLTSLVAIEPGHKQKLKPVPTPRHDKAQPC